MTTGVGRTVRLLVGGGPDLAAALVPTGGRDGGGQLASGAAARGDGATTLDVEHAGDVHAGRLLEDHGDAIGAADVLVHSLAAELARPEHGVALADRVGDDLERLIRFAKDRNTWVVLVNVSTLDPADRVGGSDAAAVAALDRHRLDLVALELSLAVGISVVDVDRLVAERGGAEIVVGPASYRPPLDAAIRDEVLYVLEDYGFFDDRTLLEQRGRKAT